MPAFRCFALCALAGQGALALDDGLALHQKVARVHSLVEAEEVDAVPELLTPTKTQLNRVKPLLREAANGAFARATAKLKLPAIPAVFRWELVGKITSWLVDGYQKPKTMASLDMLDSIIDLAAEVLGNKDIATMEDKELAEKLGDITRLHKIAQHYVEQVGAPPAVTKLLDRTAGAIKSKGVLKADEAIAMLIDVANQTAGPSMADLLFYESQVAQNRAPLDTAHLMELHMPVLKQLGAPPAVEAFIQTEADMERNKATRDPMQEGARMDRMVAQASRELGMPSSISETFDFLAETGENAAKTNLFTSQTEQFKVVSHLIELQAKMLEQLAAPAPLVQLVRGTAAPMRNETAMGPAESLNLLAQASRELSFPPAAAEFFEYLGPIIAKKGTPEPERMQELVLRLSEQVGAPDAFAKFSKDAAALAAKSGGKADPTKLSKLVAQLFKKLGMPAFADIYSKLVAPMIIKGKQPDAFALAGVAPSLMKVLPDMETANGLAKDMRVKLMKPLTTFYENAVQRLTGNMPESALKHAFKKALESVKP